MTAALFPELAPAPPPPLAATPVPFSSYPETSSTDNDDPTPGRHRRRIVLPAGGRRPSRVDPAEDAAARMARSRMRDAVIDGLASVLSADPLSYPAWLRELLERVVAKGGLRLRRGEVVRRPDRTARDWLFDLLGDMAECDEVLAFREAQCGTYDVRPQSCKARVCPECERARAARLVRVFSALLADVPARDRSFLVLTLRSVPWGELAAGFDALAEHVVSLRRRPLVRGGRCRWRQRNGAPGHPCTHPEHPRSRALNADGTPNATGRNCPTFRHAAVRGGVTTLETTVNVDERTWHPHANLVLDAPFIAQAELADTWRAVTCPDRKHRRAGWCPASCDAGSPVVWIRQVDPDGVREAIKYVTKSSDLIDGDDPVQLLEFLLATRGRRMVQGFGSFFGVQIEDEDDGEEVVTLEVEVDGVFRAGQPVVRRYRLPRFCRQCGRDTLLDAGGCTYEPPVRAPRVDVRLRNGFPSWRPPPDG